MVGELSLSGKGGHLCRMEVQRDNGPTRKQAGTRGTTEPTTQRTGLPLPTPNPPATCFCGTFPPRDHAPAADCQAVPRSRVLAAPAPAAWRPGAPPAAPPPSLAQRCHRPADTGVCVTDARGRGACRRLGDVGKLLLRGSAMIQCCPPAASTTTLACATSGSARGCAGQRRHSA